MILWIVWVLWLLSLLKVILVLKVLWVVWVLGDLLGLVVWCMSASSSMSLHHIPLFSIKVQRCPSIGHYVFLKRTSTLTPCSYLQTVQIPVLAYRTRQQVFTRLRFAQSGTSSSTIRRSCQNVAGPVPQSDSAHPATV